MFSQIKTVVEIATGGFKSIREFTSKRDRDQSISKMLKFYFILLDCIDDGENLIVEAGSNPVAKIQSLSKGEVVTVLNRWDRILRLQGARLQMLSDLLLGQGQLVVINPELEKAINKAIGNKMNRTVTLQGIGSALFFRTIFPLEESDMDKAKLVSVMVGARMEGKINLIKIHRDIAELRLVLDQYRIFVHRLASDEEILRLSNKARLATKTPK